jgi:hypothetical protein
MEIDRDAKRVELEQCAARLRRQIAEATKLIDQARENLAQIDQHLATVKNAENDQLVPSES